MDVLYRGTAMNFLSPPESKLLTVGYPRDITVLPALTLSFKGKNFSKSYHQATDIIIRHSKIGFVYRHILLFFSLLFFLSTRTKLRKATISFVMAVCPSVLLEQFGSHWADFRETSEHFSKICLEN
jgi:hypothetical protein